MAKKSLLAMGLVVLMILVTVSAWAIPSIINFQGKLTDPGGASVPDGSYNMRFVMYDDVAPGGTLLWQEDQSVPVASGIYNVQLGYVTVFPDDLFDNDALYIEVRVYNQATSDWETLEPRQQLSSTAFSMKTAKAEDAETLDGKDALDFAGSAHGHGWLEISNRPLGLDDGDDAGITTETDPTVPSSVKDGVSWSEVSGRPSGLDDGDDVGITSETDPTVPSSVKDGVSWSEVSGRPSGLDDGDDVGITSESDPQVGSNTTNRVPKWNGSALVTGSLYDNGNVGIGDSSPIAELGFGGFPPFPFIDVDRVHIWRAGDLACGFGVMPALFMQYVPEDAHIGWGTRSAQGFFTEKMRFEGPSGNLGIGVFDPTEKLDVNGNARFRNIGGGAPPLYPLSVDSKGVLTAAYPSDRRLKTNIVNIKDGLEIVEKLQGVRFNWKENPKGERRIGLIAQDVEEVVPELTFTNPVDGYMGINYAELSAVLIEAVKEQQETIDKLTARVDELETNKKAEIESLKDQLTILQKVVETLIAQQSQSEDTTLLVGMQR